jgi:hypothetical protein
MDGKQKSRDAGQHRREQKKRGCVGQPVGGKHSAHDDQPAANGDQRDDDMEKRKSSDRQP